MNLYITPFPRGQASLSAQSRRVFCESLVELLPVKLTVSWGPCDWAPRASLLSVVSAEPPPLSAAGAGCHMGFCPGICPVSGDLCIDLPLCSVEATGPRRYLQLVPYRTTVTFQLLVCGLEAGPPRIVFTSFLLLLLYKSV